MSGSVQEVSADYLSHEQKANSEKVVPPGYKITEVGVIPEDWEVSHVGAGVELYSGHHVVAQHCNSDGVGTPYLTGPSDFPDGIIQLTKFTTKPGTICKSGDVLVTVKGSGVGSVALAENSYCISRQLMALRVIRWNSSYLYQLITNSVSFFNGSATGLIPGLSRADILTKPIAMPGSCKEQTAIANALSDVDALISSLEALITKKQAIKTATLQQLLTGRTRLPQFALRDDGTPKGYKQSELGEIPDDWEVASIDNCAAKVGSGKTPTGGASVYVDSGRPFIRSQNVAWGKLDLSDVAFISEEIHQTFPTTEICRFDVLLNITGASIGRCARADTRIVGGNVNQHVCIIRTVPEQLDSLLLVELVNSRNGQAQIDSYQAGGNREGLNFSQVRNLRFAISSDSNEQAAIASVLFDMDEEIQSLGQRLAKTRQIKQGMMQSLLTGKVRLKYQS